MIRNPAHLALTLALGSTAAAQATLTPLATFGVGGWIAPGTHPYVSTGNTERGLAYNPTTGNLILVARQNVSGVSNNVRVLSGATGADLVGLDNTGLSGGTFLVNMVDVDESGAIYVCNLSTSIGVPFKVYKWDSEAAGVSTPPSVAYNAAPGITRLGDSFAVTGGSILNPAKFAAAGSNNVNASNFAVGTLDGSNVGTAFLSVPGTTTSSNDYRLGLTFIDDDTLIGNQGAAGGPARMTTFDTTLATATVDASIPIGAASRRPIDYAVILGRPLLATIDTVTSQVTVLDLTDPTAPVVLAQANNTTGPLTANGNATGAVAWGAILGNTATLYAMSTNQGIQAFQFALNPIASALPYGSGCDGLVMVGSGAPTLGNLAFGLDILNVPLISPLAWVAFGTTALPFGVDLTPIGMAGCFSYTSFDIGLFDSGPVILSTSSFAMPIALNPSLAGASVAAQGVSLSLATALNLAVSNGVEIILGF